jgi:hypothetical protein
VDPTTDVRWAPVPEDLPCQVCHRPDREESMMLCDKCNDGYHYDCVGLSEIPPGNWICPRCKGKGTTEDDIPDVADRPSILSQRDENFEKQARERVGRGVAVTMMDSETSQEYDRHGTIQEFLGINHRPKCFRIHFDDGEYELWSIRQVNAHLEFPDEVIAVSRGERSKQKRKRIEESAAKGITIREPSDGPPKRKRGRPRKIIMAAVKRQWIVPEWTKLPNEWQWESSNQTELRAMLKVLYPSINDNGWSDNWFTQFRKHLLEPPLSISNEAAYALMRQVNMSGMVTTVITPVGGVTNLGGSAESLPPILTAMGEHHASASYVHDVTEGSVTLHKRYWDQVLEHTHTTAVVMSIHHAHLDVLVPMIASMPLEMSAILAPKVYVSKANKVPGRNMMIKQLTQEERITVIDSEEEPQTVWILIFNSSATRKSRWMEQAKSNWQRVSGREQTMDT